MWSGLVVELEERFLETRGLNREIHDRRVSDGGEERTHAPLDTTRQVAVAVLDVRDPGHRLEPRGRSGESHHDVALPPSQEPGRLLQRHEPSLADNRHAIADAFHLGEDV